MDINLLEFLVSPNTGKRFLKKGQIYQGNDNNIEEESNIINEFLEQIKQLQALIQKLQDEIDKIDTFPEEATFVLKTPHDKIKNGLSLSKLDNGIVFKKEGGELEGKARVSVSNLPNPGVITIAGINVPVPKILVGTKNEDMEASSVLGEMMAENLLNVNRLTFPGVLISGPTNMLYPSSTFISETGIVLYRDKKFSAAVGGTDFVDVEDGLNAGKLCVIKEGNQKFIGRTTITIVDGEHMRNILSVTADVLNAKSAVNCEDMIIGRKEVVTDGILAVYDPSLRLTLRWGFKGPSGLTRDLIYTPPNKDGNDGDCLATDGNLNLKWVKSGTSILDGLDTGIIAFDKSLGNSKLINATLQEGKIWVGNSANKPKQVDFKVATSDASFILQKPDTKLTNAQALSELGGGIAKVEATTGKISIAKAGKGLTDDYVDPNSLKEALDEKDEEFKKIKEDCEKARDDAKDRADKAEEAKDKAEEAKDKAEEAKTKVDETKEKIDEIKTQIDEKKTEIEEKIDEFKTELEESKAQIEEAQVACEEAQTEVTTAVAEMNAAIAEANAAIAANDEAMADAVAASAASAAAAAGSAAAAAFLIGDVKNKEDKSSHKKDMEHVNGRIDDLQTEVNKKNNIAIHGTTDEINVTNSYDSSTKTNNFTISLANKQSNINILGTDTQIIVNKQDNNITIGLDEDLYKNIIFSYDFASKFALTSKDKSITINGFDIVVSEEITNEIEEIKQSLQVFANSKDIVIGTHEDGRLDLRFSEFTTVRFDNWDKAINGLGANIEDIHNLFNETASDILVFVEDKFKEINIISTTPDIIINKKEPLTFEITFQGDYSKILEEIDEIKQSLQIFANSKDIVIGTHEDGRLELRFSEFTEARFDKIEEKINNIKTNNIVDSNDIIHIEENNTIKLMLSDNYQQTFKEWEYAIEDHETRIKSLEDKGSSQSPINIIGEDNEITIKNNDNKLVIGIDDAYTKRNKISVHGTDGRINVTEATGLILGKYIVNISGDYDKAIDDKINDFSNKAAEAIASVQDTTRETFTQLIKILNTKADKSEIQPVPGGDPEKFKDYITQIVEANTTQFIKADDIPILLDTGNDGLKIKKLIHNEWLFTVQKDFIKQIIIETLKEYKLI